MTEIDERVLALLGDGRWRLLSGLAEHIAVPRRTIEESVEELRLAGHPIIGGDAGIKLTDDPLELRAYIQSRRGRALSISRGTRQLMHTANRLEGRGAGQKTLWGDSAGRAA